MKRKTNHSTKTILGVEAALRRASQRARTLAEQTGTPLVIYADGKIKKLKVGPKRSNKRAA
jgi:hypothetical protein